MQALASVQIDDERIRVTRWSFVPGAETGFHVHAYAYVVVPLVSGTLRLIEPAGVREAALRAGESYARPAGVAHNVVNANDFEFSSVEIELK